MAQRHRLVFGKGIDRFSDLTDDTICHIISFLPPRDATRTSILSRRWRYLFAWTSTLTIDDSDAIPIHDQKDSRFSFQNVVTKVMFSRSRATIEKFRLILIRKLIDEFMVDALIHYALYHGVKELELCISSKRYFDSFNKMPSVNWLFTCKTLVRLELEFRIFGFVLKVPDEICLPNLKVLHLGQLQFSDDESVARLFSRCLMLEELVIRYCAWMKMRKFSVSNPTLKRITLMDLVSIGTESNYLRNKELEINAPNLVYFELFGFAAEVYSLLNLQSLVQVHLDVGPCVKTAFYQTGAANLLRGISHVQSLHFGSNFSRAYGLHRLPTMFPNLTYLKIRTSFYYDWENMLCSSPYLETLVVELELPKLIDGLLIPKTVPSCLWSHLKNINILSFHGERDELRLVEYFLLNAQVLYNLTVDISKEKRDQKSEITKALVSLPGVSNNCRVVIV